MTPHDALEVMAIIGSPVPSAGIPLSELAVAVLAAVVGAPFGIWLAVRWGWA